MTQTTALSQRRRTIQEQQADDAFRRATKDSIQAARQQQAIERAQFSAQTGGQFHPFQDGQLLHPRTR